MKNLIIPQPIKIMFESVEAGTLTFASFVQFLLDSDSRTNNSGKAIRASVRIEQAILNVEPSTTIELSDDDYKLLSDLVEEPEGGYPVMVISNEGNSIKKPIGRQLMPFIEIFGK